jgi:hypothetical protein
MAFRVTDAGELEVVRKTPYTFTDGGEYVEGESERPQVLARWGHERSSSISGCPPRSLRYALERRVSRLGGGREHRRRRHLRSLTAPQGLQLGTTLTGTLYTGHLRSRVRITPEGEPMIERTFTQDSGSPAWANQFGIRSRFRARVDTRH